MIRYIELPQAMGILKALGFHVRDVGLLGSALSRPSSSMFGVEAYPEIEMKAAALLASLSQNHPLFDGNKRSAWVLTLTFLELNGIVIDMPIETGFELVIATAQGQRELSEIAASLRVHIRAER